MSIQYKFRSSVNFESLQIDGQPSISVGDLRAKIVRNKKLNLSQGFDLLFSDALTGLEYKSYSDQIKSGSSVIVRRVPAEMVPSTMKPANFDDKLRIRDSKLAIPRCISLPVEEDLAAFGVDLYPTFKTATDHSLQFDKQKCIGDEMPKNAPPRNGTQKSDVPLPNRRMGCAHLQKADLSSDLKCSLCSTFFKEAVLMRCCQFSFCLQCISTVLTQKGRCPLCGSSKYDVADLIPNITLRRAVEQFLQSKLLMSDEDKSLRKDAPDAESGNQATGYCSAVPIGHRELTTPVSLSASGKGSNQIIAEYVSESRYVCGSRAAVSSPYFQWENQPNDIHQRSLHEEGGDKIRTGIRRHSMGDRTCYMCGSPDHSMRDCLLASNPPPLLPAGNPMFPGPMPSYGSPFWNGIAIAPMWPYNNMYANSGMMHFNPAMLPSSPYVVSPYTPSMYGGQPVPSGIIGKGVVNNFTHQYRAGSKLPCHPSELLELRNSEKRQRISNESLRNVRSYGDADDDECLRTTEQEKSRKCKDRVEREQSACYFEDSFTQRSPKINKEYHHRDSYRIHTSHRSYPRR